MANTKSDNLNARTKRFCELLAADKENNQGKAYEDAGFKAKGVVASACATRMLKKAKVQAYLQKLRDARSKRTNIDADWVFTKLVKLTEICMAATPVMVRVKGVMIPSGLYKVDSFGANKAIETITKCLGMYKDKGDSPVIPAINNTINVGIDFGKYSNEQVGKALKELVTTTIETGGNRIVGKRISCSLP